MLHRPFLSLLLAMALMILALVAIASDEDLLIRNDAEFSEALRGVVQNMAKASVDTVYLMGGPVRGDGNFQDDYYSSYPMDEGWTSEDMTDHSVSLWHLSTFNAELLDEVPVSNRAMYCGESILACSEEDPAEGYPNNSREWLDWKGIVPNEYSDTTVRVTARLNYDTEEEYDWFYLQLVTGDDIVDIQSWTGSNLVDGVFVPVDVDTTFVVGPADYTGTGEDEVHLRWSFVSDAGWSDGDCLYPTKGAAQIDNITVEFGGVPWVYDDFEPGSWVNWEAAFPPTVGDFSRNWIELDDIDPCSYNDSPRWAFIDDGRVVAGTGGYTCATWCYGPGGYVVNPAGGLAGPDYHLHNVIRSPVLEWPAEGYDGAVFAFDAYRHEMLDTYSAGVFYVWQVRSTTDPAGETGWSGWVDRNYVYYGGPDWIRHQEDVTDLLVPGRTFVQVAIGVQEAGYVWGSDGNDATPAPYFDNCALIVYEFSGAAIAGEEITSAQDNFPEIGDIDLSNLAANSVRFDMAMNISPIEHQRNDPGDSIVYSIRSIRVGSELDDMPKLVYRLRRNTLFDSGRTSGLPDDGWVYGDSVFAASGAVVPHKFAFDLPDTGFFFPGDVLHYYIEATDRLGGSVSTTFLPGDTTGFALFPGDEGYQVLRYPSVFTVRALPSVFDVSGDQPPMLLWNDFGSRGGENEWTYALRTLGYAEGLDYDIYFTNGPSSGVGNGLGGRATSAQLDEYETLLYTVGDLSTMTICNGDYQSAPGDDVGLLDAWLGVGDRQLLLTGDNIVYDLQQFATGANFISNWLPVSLVDYDLRPQVNFQAAPEVKPLVGNPVFTGSSIWRAYGGCVTFNTFDAIEPNLCTSLAEYLGPDGAEGAYSFSAAVLYDHPTYNNTTIYLPYDFMYIYDSENTLPRTELVAERAFVLLDVLLYFGYTPSGEQFTAVPDEPAELSVRGYPNPFNPATKIAYLMPRDGRLSIRIYNVRGELVNTLLDREIEAGSGHVTWDGTDGNGRSVSSGTYFCRTRAGDEEKVAKLSLIK